MLAAKSYDIIMGVDVHIIQPPGPVPPLPIPHPFIGMVFDPMDFVPMIGASVFINGMPRAQAGSSGKNVPPHIPMGGTFVKPIGNECEIFMGSSTVLVEGSPFARMSMPVISCQCVGAIAPKRTGKSSKAGFFLPTSVLIAIPGGNPVLIGGPPTIDMMGMLTKLGLSALGKLRKSKMMKKLSGKLQDAAAAVMKKLKVPPSLQNMVHKAICFVTGHPVDVATGKVFTDAIDIELPGPVPFKWERTWYSCSVYEGPLGHGWHHSYDMALAIDVLHQVVALRMPDGRPVAFPFIKKGEELYDAKEKLTLINDEKGWGIKDKNRHVHRFMASSPHDPEIFLLTAIENAEGFSIEFFYNANGYLQTINDSAGRTIQVINDAQGRITELRTGNLSDNFKLVSYHYDQDNDLREVRDANEQAMAFDYGNHLLIKETNRNGLSFYFEYDGKTDTARCIHTWGDNGIYDHKISYGPGLTTVTNSSGYKTMYVLDGQGLVNQVIDASGNISFTDYDSNTNLLRETDAAGLSTSYTYDERGNQTSVILPDGAAFNTIFKDDLPVIGTTPSGATIVWKYNDKGQLIQRIDPLGEVKRFDYRNGFLHSIAEAENNLTTLTYDRAGNLVTMQMPDGSKANWRYDAMGNCIAVTDPKSNLQQFVYNKLNQLVQVYEPDGNTRFLRYDPEGNIIQAKDNQHEVAFEYGGMNRLTARMEAGTRVEFQYDKEENLTAIKNEHGYPYLFRLNAIGDVLEEIGFDGLLRRYERDTAGKVTRVHRGGGRSTEYQYDEGGRVILARYSDGVEERYAYRQDGEVVTAENNFIAVEFERDTLGNVLKEKQGSFEIVSQYDQFANRTSIVSSLGAHITHEKNIVGDILKTTAGNGNAAWETHFKRDIMGQEIERSLPGGLSARWERDRLGRPTRHTVSKSGTRLRDKKYTWNINDRLASITDDLKGTMTTYTHDSLGNLAAAKYDDGQFDYRMPDAVGNLFRAKEQTGRKYGPAGQLLEAAGTKYTYDAEGNLIQKVEPGNKTWKYDWYGNGMLKQVLRPDGATVDFVYDALGRRIGKTYKGQTTRFVWDGNTPLHEWAEDAAVVKWGESNLEINDKGQLSSQTSYHAKILQPVTTWIFEDDNFVPMAKLVGNSSHSIITDHIGTPVAMYDQEGEHVWAAEYDIYGKIRNIFGRQSACPFRYQGQYEDEETGLYYNRFRYYDAESGVYVSQDPIGLDGSRQFYGYVNDTTGWVDPFGLKKKSCSKANPAFGNLKDHANRHGQGLTTTKYYNQAVAHTKSGKRFKVVHEGKTKYAYVTRLGEDQYRFTSGNVSGSRIFTHMDVDGQYLSNKGIGLPKGF